MKGFLALTVGVLAAIGIGIGVEAAVGVGSTSYEANGVSFIARFPSLPTTTQLLLHNGGQVTTFVSHYHGAAFGLVVERKPSKPPSVREEKAVNRRVCELGLYCGWIAYAPLTDSSVSFAGQQPSEISAFIKGKGAVDNVLIHRGNENWSAEVIGASNGDARLFFSSIQLGG